MTGVQTCALPIWDHAAGDRVVGDQRAPLRDRHARDQFLVLAEHASDVGQHHELRRAERLGDGARLRHCHCAGAARGRGLLDDYANMARAALALLDARGGDAYLAQARAWVESAEAFFRDGRAGGYFMTPSDGERLIVRSKSAADTAAPAGNATLLAVLVRLHALTGETRYRDRADALMAAFGVEAERAPLAHCAFLNAAEGWYAMTRVVIVGAPGDAETRALTRAALRAPALDRVIIRVAPGAALPPGHPARGRVAIDDRATAYVCAGQTCSLPIVEPDALRAALARPHASPRIRDRRPGPR